MTTEFTEIIFSSENLLNEKIEFHLTKTKKMNLVHLVPGSEIIAHI